MKRLSLHFLTAVLLVACVVSAARVPAHAAALTEAVLSAETEAQPATTGPTVTARISDLAAEPIGEVLIDETVVLRIRASFGNYSVGERTSIVAERLAAALAAGIEPYAYGIDYQDGAVALTAAGQHLVVVDRLTAEGAGGTPLAVAVIWLQNIRGALGWRPLTGDRSDLTSRSERSWTGIASWYGAPFQGHETASGVPFDMNAYTAAHKTLPFGTLLLVTSVKTGLSTVVMVNDRGPFIAGREIDLSRAAAAAIGLIGYGVGQVRIDLIR